MSITTVRVSLSLSDDEKTATIRLSSRKTPIVCCCLGVLRDDSGVITKAYLDSRIHSTSKDVCYVGYELSGAISTILTALNTEQK